MVITLIILALSAFFFVNGKIRSDVVALCALVLLILCGILTPEEALSGFSNSIVIMMVGLFVVGGAIFQTGLAKMISSKILQLAGKSELKLFILIMLVTSAIGAFVSNTGTVALMLPIVVSMAVSANVSPSRFLMPLAFASSMGGMATLIGTPPNLVIQNTLLEGGFEGLSFFSFTPVGVICVLIGIVVLIPLSRMFLVKKGEKKTEKKARKKSLEDLAYEYQIAQNLFRVGVKSDSTFRGKTLVELNITGKYNVTILEIRRESKSQNPFMKTIDQELAGPNTSLQTGDVLYVLGAFAQIELLTKDNNLDLLDTRTAEVSEEKVPRDMVFGEIGIAEVLLMPNSQLINRAVKD
ncbi:MAG: SLC13 family permease, partial [Butyricimonas faecihominis]